LGRAGHSSAILKELDNNGLLIGIDKDAQAISESKIKLKKINNNFKLFKSDFSNFDEVLEKNSIPQVDGILLDLGVSSPQLDDGSRGFSYNKDNLLDMRMDQSQKLTAYEVVNNYSQEQLFQIFRNNAQLKFASLLSKIIIKNRPIKTTTELSNIIRTNLPAKLVRIKNQLRPIFQAIRMEVNSEIESINIFLSKFIKYLKLNGRICIITFHSIEDKLVKNFFKKISEDNTGKLPIMDSKKFTFKTKKPNKVEISKNNRSRSAKLRILIKRS
jgi:16S rRNA (cytosine1402-N4)-methyltransferase